MRQSSNIVLKVIFWVWLLSSRPLSADGVLTVELSHAQAKNFGIATQAMVVNQPSASQMNGLSSTAVGIVLDPAPLISQLMEVDAAVAALSISTDALMRVTRLYRNAQNASKAQWQQATMTRNADATTLARAHNVLRTSLGAAADAMTANQRQQLVGKLIRQDVALARVEVDGNLPIGINIVANANDHIAISQLGPAPQADSQSGKPGVLIWLRPGKPAQTRLQVQLTLTDPVVKGTLQAQVSVQIPRSAVVRLNGGSFVFVERPAEKNGNDSRTFELREVHPLFRDADNWRVAENFSDTERVVTLGVAGLLTHARGTPEED